MTVSFQEAEQMLYEVCLPHSLSTIRTGGEILVLMKSMTVLLLGSM